MIVLRDAGGIGDIVRIGALVDALAAQGPVDFVAPPCYSDLYQMIPSIAGGAARWTPTAADFPVRNPMARPVTRWGELGVQGFPSEEWVIDLMCPALRHEMAMLGHPTKDRLSCWATAAGIKPARVSLVVPDSYDREAAAWAASLPRPAIAVSPHSNASIRTWRNTTASRGHTGAIGGLLQILRKMGYEPVVMGSRLAGWATSEGDLRVQAARMRYCRAFVGPDSGMLHIACALGVPSVGIFGPTDATLVLAPYPGPWKAISGRFTSAVRSKARCSRPCYGMKYLNRKTCGGNCMALERVTEEEVAAAVHSLARPTQRRLSLSVAGV